MSWTLMSAGLNILSPEDCQAREHFQDALEELNSAAIGDVQTSSWRFSRHIDALRTGHFIIPSDAKLFASLFNYSDRDDLDQVMSRKKPPSILRNIMGIQGVHRGLVVLDCASIIGRKGRRAPVSGLPGLPFLSLCAIPPMSHSSADNVVIPVSEDHPDFVRPQMNPWSNVRTMIPQRLGDPIVPGGELLGETSLVDPSEIDMEVVEGPIENDHGMIMGDTIVWRDPKTLQITQVSLASYGARSLPPFVMDSDQQRHKLAICRGDPLALVIREHRCYTAVVRDRWNLHSDVALARGSLSRALQQALLTLSELDPVYQLLAIRVDGLDGVLHTDVLTQS
ncbi:hypothetical protein DXG01_004087 [Tephrocybe rancida]|nr:hypothetical protein DXG01_004087 [Tephrocybe rancida]